MISVAGGVYAERCIEPHWDDVYGSGGRAAAALSEAINGIKLYSYQAEEIDDGLENLTLAYGIDIAGPKIRACVSFDYMHSLADPRITPRPDAIVAHDPFEVKDDVVLRFGMLEGSAKVIADCAIYDPQSAFDPQPFGENGSEAKRLALVLNRLEASKFTGESNPEKALDILLSTANAEVVILKMGGRGALVGSGKSRELVPAYKSPGVWKIGSGDVFSAAFALFWGVEELGPDQAADLASRATSYYCGTKSLPIPSRDVLTTMEVDPVSGGTGKVYIAAPFFNLAERWMVEELRDQLLNMGVEVFSPLHDVGVGSGHDVAKKDLEGLDDCQAVIAILNGGDAGTIFEVGYAVSKGIPVVALAQNMRPEDIKMPEGTGCHIVTDFVSAIYHTIWLLP